jgi:hypothetical protein
MCAAAHSRLRSPDPLHEAVAREHRDTTEPPLRSQTHRRNSWTGAEVLLFARAQVSSMGDAEETQMYWGGGIVGTVLLIVLVLFVLGRT